MDKEVWTYRKDLLKMAEFEVSVESVLDHFAYFGVSNLPDNLSSVFQHGKVAV